MDIEDTPQSPRLNQRGNIYCPTCKIWTKYEQVIGGVLEPVTVNAEVDWRFIKSYKTLSTTQKPKYLFMTKVGI